MLVRPSIETRALISKAEPEVFLTPNRNSNAPEGPRHQAVSGRTSSPGETCWLATKKVLPRASGQFPFKAASNS